MLVFQRKNKGRNEENENEREQRNGTNHHDKAYHADAVDVEDSLQSTHGCIFASVGQPVHDPIHLLPNGFHLVGGLFTSQG